MLFGLALSISDRVLRIFNDDAPQPGYEIVKAHLRCSPWTDHVHKSALKSISMAISDGNFEQARSLLALGRTEDANEFCIELLDSFIKCHAGNVGETVNFETYFNFYFENDL